MFGQFNCFRFALKRFMREMLWDIAFVGLLLILRSIQLKRYFIRSILLRVYYLLFRLESGH